MDALCESATLSAEDGSQIEGVTQPNPKSRHTGKATNDLPNLDLLRSVAVGLVFFGHLTAVMKVRIFGDLAHFGVLLFFVHTSLVLMLSMGRLGLSDGRLYTSFMVRRIFRIYPLSILTVCMMITFHIPSVPWGGTIGGYIWPGWFNFLSNIFLIQNITHSESVLCVLWSLPFEVQMYAVLPLLYILIHRFYSLRATSMIWLAGVIIAGVEYIVRSKTDSDFLLLRYFPCFLAGVFAWRLITTKKRLLPGWLLVLFLMTLVTLYRLEDVLRVYGPNWHSALHGALRNDHQIWLPMYLDLVRDWVFCGITGLAVPFFADIKLRFLNASTKKIAQYSYGIYLCHVPMMWFCFRILHLGNAAVSAVLCVFLTALTSFLLYHSIEQPAIRLGKHLSTRLVNGIAFT